MIRPQTATARRARELALAKGHVAMVFGVELDTLERAQEPGKSEQARRVLAWVLVEVHGWSCARVANTMFVGSDRSVHLAVDELSRQIGIRAPIWETVVDLLDRMALHSRRSAELAEIRAAARGTETSTEGNP